MIKLLVVEDDLQLSNSVTDFLESFADVTQVFDGEEGLFEADQGIYDLILLDLMLPEISGFDVLKRLREKNIDTPVLIITAKEGLDDKMKGFKTGADDYLTKPFYLDELKARITVLLKRAGKLADDNIVSYADLKLNVSNREAFIGDKPVDLLGKEFDLILYLMQNQNVILPKEQIFDRIWGFDSDTTITVIEVYMSKARKKLRDTEFSKKLQTLRNVGYILK